MAALQALRQILKASKHSTLYEKFLQHVDIISAADGKVRCTMPVKEEHLNGMMSLHGGLTASLVDSISSMAFATKEGKFGVSVDLNVSYLAAAKVGDVITISSEVLKHGGTLGFATVDIHKQDGTLIATGRHTKFLKV